MKIILKSLFSIAILMVIAVSYGKEPPQPKASVTDVTPSPELVDLGLSVKWASCNLGASKPEDSGGYYQWGGTKNVTDERIILDWNNCPYHTGSSYFPGWTKYFSSDMPKYWSGTGSPDNKTVLDPEDDVAHVVLGGSWRMPTDAEWEELRQNCTWEWIRNITGAGGYKMTSKKPGYTNKSIFLPAAGVRSGSFHDNNGPYGRYWSSSIYQDAPWYAYFFGFHEWGNPKLSYGERFYGLSVRPVSE